GNDECARVIFFGDALHCAYQRPHHDTLKTRGQILDSLGWLFSISDGLQTTFTHVLRHRRFQPAETEIGPTITHARDRKVNGQRVSLASETLDNGTARITQTQHFRYFIESFAGRIIA